MQYEKENRSKQPLNGYFEILKLTNDMMIVYDAGERKRLYFVTKTKADELLKRKALQRKMFDGDWKGSISYTYPEEVTVEYIFHIKGDNCSQELTQRTSNEHKETMIYMDVVGDYIELGTHPYGIFKGKFEDGKIIGEWSNLSKPRRLILTKFGEGVINVEKKE